MKFLKNNYIGSRKNIYFFLLLVLISSCLGIEKNNLPLLDIENLINPLSIDKPYTNDDFSFLNWMISDSVRVVQLGESIHVTKEFPAARLNFVKYLHQIRSFDILTLEGSAIDSWLAMDYLIHSNDSDSVKVPTAQLNAWFGLWQTDAMQEVMAYVLETQNTQTPLYLASFDIQAGSSRGMGGARIIDTLFNTLSKYHTFENIEFKEKWNKQFKQLIHCQGFKNDSIRDSELVKTIPIAIKAFKENWVEQVIPIISSNHTIHGKALQLIPDNLMDRYCHCDSVYLSSNRHTYQIERDKHNANNVLFIADSLSQSHKIITWAHHSHINHTSIEKGNIPSMGKWLKQKLNHQLYTIGTFAGKGQILAVNDDWLFPIAQVNIFINSKYKVEKLLSTAAPSQYFMDLKQFQNQPLAESIWSDTLTCRYEKDRDIPTILSKDYDGVIFIQEISAPKLMILPEKVQWIPKVWGFLIQNTRILIGVSIVFLLFLVYFFRERLKRRNEKKDC